MNNPVMRNANGSIGPMPKRDPKRKPAGFTKQSVAEVIRDVIWNGDYEAAFHKAEIEKCAAAIVRMAKRTGKVSITKTSEG